MAEARYTIGEAVSLLDVDRVTLKRWMDVENMVPQTDPRDKRIKYVTREQLLELARLHGKVIRDETSIGPRLTGVQRDMVERIQHTEEVNAALLADRLHQEEVIAALMARIDSLEHALGHSVPREPREDAPTPPDAPAYAPPPVLRYTPPAAYYGQRLRRGEWRTLPPIPDGWIVPSKFAREIGIAERTFSHALRPRYDGDKEQRGHLDFHEGRWRADWPGTLATQLLDPEQQEAARAWFATRPRGQ